MLEKYEQRKHSGYGHTMFMKIAILLIIIVGCKKISNQTNFNKNTTATEENNTIFKNFSDNKKDLEYILIDSLVINENIPFKGSLSYLSEVFKKTDSINPYGYECGSELEQKNVIHYYGRTEVEVSNQLYCLRNIDFKSTNIKLKFRDIIFDNLYSLENFSKQFPNSFQKNLYENKNTIEIYIPTINSDEYDTTLRFYFSQGKLIRIMYFIPC